tara:strand:+ start:159 stop:806 length:648 start_codon:yes stop_codon:yes gene_type:complete
MGKKSREKMYNEMRSVADQQTKEARAAEAEAQTAVEESRAAYEGFQFQNPYAGMENVYEDLTVNQQQAEFQRQTFQQQQANIMQGLQGAAGGSGVAALAQAMANQGQLQSQQISASIGQQEAMNQKLKAQGAGQVQMMEAQGEAMVQQAESGRVSTLLGMDYGELAAARGQVQQGLQNQQSAVAANMEMKAANRAANMSLAGDILDTATSFIPTP